LIGAATGKLPTKLPGWAAAGTAKLGGDAARAAQFGYRAGNAIRIWDAASNVVGFGQNAQDIWCNGLSWGNGLSLLAFSGALRGNYAEGFPGNYPKGVPSTKSTGYPRRLANDTGTEFQPYNGSGFAADGQRHHLNQSDILGGTVPYGDGVTTPMPGNAFRGVDTPHFLSHRGTEAFFDQYRGATTRGAKYSRPNGVLFGEMPSFSQYNRALYNSLQNAGVPSNRSLAMVQAAKAEQLAAGFHGSSLLPELPARMGQKGGL
jgi:hypothetical protein